jgi:hypothetical protein
VRQCARSSSAESQEKAAPAFTGAVPGICALWQFTFGQVYGGGVCTHSRVRSSSWEDSLHIAVQVACESKLLNQEITW